jgi:gliding motility-associated-like protein
MLKKYGIVLLLLAVSGVLRGQADIDTTVFSLPTVQACPGDTVLLPITVENFEEVRAFQFLVEWNPAQLSFVDTCAVFSSSISTNQIAAGRLWFLLFGIDLDPNTPSTLPDGDTLVILKFVVTNLEDAASVFFNNLPPSLSSSVVVNSPVPGASSISFLPRLNNGGVQFLDMELQLTTSPITCAAPGQVQADSPVPGLTYAWYQNDLFYAATPDTVAATGGAYDLVASVGACLDTQRIIVAYDTLPPPAPILSDDTLNCLVSAVNLAPANLSLEWAYQWISPSGDSTLGPELMADTAGLYTLQATDPGNGCLSASTALIVDQTQPLNLDFWSSGDIDCRRDTALRIAQYPDSLNLSLEWRLAGGPLLSTSDTLQTAQAGLFVLLATDLLSGCTASDTFAIAENRQSPAAAILGDTMLNCQTPSLTFAVDSLPPDVLLAWLDEMGNTLGTLPSLDWDRAGPLQLLLTDTLNGCSFISERLVAIDTLPPNASLSTFSDTLTCARPQVLLESTGASADWIFAWSREGLPVGTGSSLNLETPGLYALVVRDTANGCETSLEAVIAQDTIAPDLAIVGDSLLTCIRNSLTLNMQSSAPEAACAWQGQGSGCELTVSAPGIYIAELTDPRNGCRSVDSIAVSQVDSLPVFAALASGSINCAQAAVILSSDTLLPQAAYVWLDAATDTLAVGYSATVAQAGTYTLAVMDSLTGCTAQQLVMVEADLDEPTGSAAAGGILDCATAAVSLDAGGLSPHTVFVWQDSNGQVLSDALAAAPGLYYLELQDTLNFCTSLDSVEVEGDYGLPGLVVNVVGDSVLTCLSSQVSLQASAMASAVGYLWQDASGDTLSMQPGISVSEAGVLRLQAVNLDNGCVQDTLLEVSADLSLPAFMLSDTAGLLSCTEERLLFTATPISGAVAFTWQGPSGSTVSVADTLEAALPGLYALIAVNVGNGCQDTVLFEVEQDISIPEVSILGDSVLNCHSVTLSLMAASAATGLDFIWRDASGAVLSGTGMLSVELPGAYTLLATDTLTGCAALRTIVIESDFAAPGVSLVSAGEVLNCRQTSLVLSASGNLTGLALAWMGDGQPLGQSDSLQVTAGGNYTLSALDTLNGCDTLLSIFIAQDTTAPVLDIVGDNLLSCAVSSLTLSMQSSTPEVACAWQGQGSGCELTVSAPGIYIAELTDQRNGCRSVDSIAVSQVDSLPAFMVFASAALSCRTESVVLQADTLFSAATYTWLNQNMEVLANTPMLTVSQAGIYLLEVTDSLTACSAQRAMTVEIDLDPPAGQATASGSLDCRTTAVDLTASGVADGVVLDWQDSNGQALPVAVAEQAGWYYLLLTDPLNGCSRLDSVAVSVDDELPALEVSSASETVLTCLRQTVNWNASSTGMATFVWQQASGDTLAQSAAFAAVLPGLYRLTATLLRNGCARDTLVEVIEDRVPPDADIQIVQDFDCVLQEAVLSAVANDRYAYRWSGPDVDPASANAAAVTVFELGSYVLEVTDTVNGCTASAAIALMGDPEGIQGLTFDVQPISCNGTDDGGLTVAGGIGGTPPYFYSLNGVPIGADARASGLAAGDYTLSALDARGCSVDTVFSIAEATGHSLSVQPEQIQLRLGDSVTLRAFFNIDPSLIRQVEWLVNGQPIAEGLAALKVSPTSTTRYAVISTDENGCTSQAWVDVRVDRRNPFYVPNAFSPNGDGRNEIFAIYPGPGVQQVQRLQIFDRWGSHILEQEFDVQGWDGTYRGQLAPGGVYVFQVDLELVDGTIERYKGEVLLLR